MPRKEQIEIDGSKVELLVGEPTGAAPFPGIVVTHHGPGLDDFTADFIDKLAGAGFLAAAPYFYHRRPETETRGEMIGNLDDLEIIADIEATVGYLRGRPDINGDRLAIAGHCLGGRNSLLGAEALMDFSACAVFYGGNIMVGRGRTAPTPYDLIGELACPVIGFFGNEDDNPSPEDADKIDAEMTRLDKAHRFHRYAGTGHAFQNFMAEDRFRPESSADAQGKLIEFLKGALS